MSSSCDTHCGHESLIYNVSHHAENAGYDPKTVSELRVASGLRRGQCLDNTAFPEPLVLPADEIAINPSCTGQSVRLWQQLRERNTITAERHTIYVAAAPIIEPEVSQMALWSILNACHPAMLPEDDTNFPDATALVDYLSAFYYGLPVKLLPTSPAPLRFMSWENSQHQYKDAKKRMRKATFVALATSEEAIRVRVRRCPDQAFPYQLNLNDILDVVMAILPADAHSLLLIVNHDLYEDDDDDFCCGRAYGGSRCAVVSTARYNPLLLKSDLSALDFEHPWPASHCEDYVKNIVKDHKLSAGKGEHRTAKEAPGAKRDAEVIDLTLSPGETQCIAQKTSTPLEAAIDAYKATKGGSDASAWQYNVSRTASHELGVIYDLTEFLCLGLIYQGHCFGIGHCVYYACVMQGTASMVEDTRQPSYMCPVDLEKLKKAIGEYKGHNFNWQRERYKALLAYCEDHVALGHHKLWAASAGWLRQMLRLIDTNGKGVI